MYLVLLGFSSILAIVASEKFLINNEKCKIPDFPVFSDDVKKYHTKLYYINCNNSQLLTYTTVENNTAYLHIDRKALDSTSQAIDCCYKYVSRKGSKDRPDAGIEYSKCHPFNSTVALEQSFVSVECKLGANKTFKNAHSTIVITKAVEEKLKKFKKEAKKRPLSVLFMLIDAVSRLNFERTMPLTKKFLLANNFTEYIAYNKIDDNSFPNFNALITGLNLKQSNEICKPTQVGGLDKCPMIWYDFRNFGYATAYAEDWPDISTYNYQKKGFKNPPTDYYFKPYMEAATKLGVKNYDNMPYCAGPETQGERIMNIAKDFSKTFKDQPSFGAFWMNTFSHDRLSSPSRMDEKFKAFVEDIKREGILDRSMVVVFADHGFRYEYKNTNQGWYEDKLPMNFISLPKWFQEEYPKKYQNFKDNSKKFTSTYDFYLTLQDILALSVENYTMTGSKACATCASFFAEHPEGRGCADVGISTYWCTCHPKKKSAILQNILP
ncbi:uncharacterized protein [Diabrotica undecimpunctata]|uniref:uncharacterized protein n=1 Tax=Diabrotica undecimpunctata TaxID=50387 RepID=UPI003B63811E